MCITLKWVAFNWSLLLIHNKYLDIISLKFTMKVFVKYFWKDLLQPHIIFYQNCTTKNTIFPFPLKRCTKNTYTYFFSKVAHPMILFSIPIISFVTGPWHDLRSFLRSVTLVMKELMPLEKSSSSSLLLMKIRPR